MTVLIGQKFKFCILSNFSAMWTTTIVYFFNNYASCEIQYKLKFFSIKKYFSLYIFFFGSEYQFHSAIETWCSAIFKAKTVPLIASIWSFVRMWSTNAELLLLTLVGWVICIFSPCFSKSWTYFLAMLSLVEEASMLKSPAIIKGNLVDNAVWKMSSNSFKMSLGDFPLGR